MINLTGKSVFVRTQEEYLSVLKMARLQGFTWATENHLDPIEIPFPNILNFNDSKIVTYSCAEKTLHEASEIIEDGEEITDAVKLVRAFAKCPDTAALTDSFIKSLELLANIVESQMEEVKKNVWSGGVINMPDKPTPEITPQLAISAFAVLHQYCSSISPHDCIRCTFYEHCPECFMGCPGDQGEVIRKLQSNE